ncbi:unnamed protein product [Cuscuta epithymum]|uniref:Biotin carboxylation domain-containing protein n=1 Tax=Cuscuta epithymum TaxID=186058 RepID=A0AAV0FY09_9ASTE|nr:unnamed protein product [Cuscuta epithymum]CAH9139945.1 unnamed protein product [Cuscuta epithymum]
MKLGKNKSLPSPCMILLANRGEIACRIIRTAKRFGIRTVSVYSDADKYNLHVKSTDEAVRIGPPPARLSYLNASSIIEAATRTGSQLMHESNDSKSNLSASLCLYVGLKECSPSSTPVCQKS